MATTAAEERLQAEQLVGTGLTSEVFAWGNEPVLKPFLPRMAG